ncbi:Tyrosine--tRNA ligase [Candidatus Tiddalikarchaeum anstoanum]|nr:Tyrosine--tRNA ligase [Candidatus Tiddalikarchaeum anstoanum]
MNTDQKLELIKKNTIEIIGEDELRQKIDSGKAIKAYWGRAPTGALHMGHAMSLSKIFDLQKAGVKPVILIADIHAALDDQKAPWEQIDKRAEFTKKCIELALPWSEKPNFITGSSYQLSKNYELDLLKISTMVTITRATRAASEVTRMKDPKVSELIYPIMQALDEQYLEVDMQWGGVDQRHIMALAREYLPKIGYKPRTELMLPLICSLKGPEVKMSSSIPDSIIKVYDSEKSVTDKIRNSYCPEGDIKDNPILQLCQRIIFPIRGKMKIERPAKFGGDIEFTNYAELEKVFQSKKLHPLDLKNALTKELIILFKPAREYFEKHIDTLKELGLQFMP